MMWFLLLLYIAHIEPVLLQGVANRLILKGGRNPCEGHIEVYHNNSWGYVGDTKWSVENEEVVCRSTQCGGPLTRSHILRPLNGKVWLNEISCNGNERHLWDCENPGFGNSISPKDSVRKIKCSTEIKISLEGFQCEGAVRYSRDGGESYGYFCADNWGINEANLLCQSLECGQSQSILQWKEGISNSERMGIDCSGIENLDNLWQCATTPRQCSRHAAVTCTGHKRVQLTGNTQNVCHGQLEMEDARNGNWIPVNNSNTISPDITCQQMHCGTSASHSVSDKGMQLNCTDNVKVVLMDKDSDKTSECYGAVYIKVNNETSPVCASTWTKENADVVCKELNCGNVVVTNEMSSAKQRWIITEVKCTGKESSLWHCRANHQSSLSCSSHAYVICAASTAVRLMDGPGICAGRVEILYGGVWNRIKRQGWTVTNSETVCKEMKCGAEGNLDSVNEFSQGSSDFLPKAFSCKSNAKKISECISDNSQHGDNEAAALTCKDQKVVFLNGSCSGEVGIEHNGKTHWLSGHNETWNQESANTVCRQMHCGNATAFNSSSSAARMDEIWKESISCSSSTTSLFNCDKVKKPQGYDETIATVTCSGSIKVNLTNGCWGNVAVCVGMRCGDLCGDTWSYEKAVMLCGNLGCGRAIQSSIKKSDDKSEVIVKSVHITKATTNLNQSILVRNYDKETTCPKGRAYTVCSGSIKSKISGSRYKCSGNVEVYHEGQWLPVCMNALEDIKTQTAICEEMKCGRPVKTVDYFGPRPTAGYVISDINCPLGGKALKECGITGGKGICPLGGLQCSSWSKMELKFNTSCSGAVFVHSDGQRDAVSAKGWTETEGKRLCQDLQCGDFSSNTTMESENSFWNRSFSCKNDSKNIWDCEQPASPSQEQQQLFIECGDEPRVALSEKCRGEVRINNVSVCEDQWNLKYSHLVCHEQGCSKAISFDHKPSNADEGHHVKCEDYHDKLGQCSRLQGTCQDNLVTVYCVGGIKFQTTEQCGGQIEVNYRNEWEKVCLGEFSSQFQEMLCEELGCGGHNRSIKSTNKYNKVILDTRLACNTDHKDVKHCVSEYTCGLVQPAEIYCNDYVRKITKAEPTSSVPIILGAGLLLVVVILIIVITRVCIVKKAKKPKNVSSKMLSGQDVEFESGDYEGITTKGNEMEDFSHGRFRSESKIILEGDARSTSSLSYDDIDEVVQAQPMNTEATTAGASGQNYFHEDVLHQEADGIIYEVDDQQENYDDIEAGPEVTKAEVHDSPQTTLENRDRIGAEE